MKCHSDQIVITSGATQAFSLIAKMLLSHGAQVIIEDPITHEIQTIFTAAGATLCPVPVDEQGMRTDLLSYGLKPSFIFVTPSHQFPMGGILPIQRRIQLIQFAPSNIQRYKMPKWIMLNGIETNDSSFIAIRDGTPFLSAILSHYQK